MSYEPTLVIVKKDLDDNIKLIEADCYAGNEEVEKVASYLIDVNSFPTIKFGELELVLCTPEFTSFNALVRTKLHDLNIDFRTDY